MGEAETPAPDSTALRVALWRALHLEVDGAPHIIEDRIGLQLAAPAEGWHQRPDMNPLFTRLFRASIVARARFIEDLVLEQAAGGTGQYVILGAGLDSFAQRWAAGAGQLEVFEIDRPGPQAWKRQRLLDCGYGLPSWLHLVPLDFEEGYLKADGAWLDALKSAGFDPARPAVIASTGVSMYLSREANAATLRAVAALAPGSVFAMTFLQPVELADAEERVGFEAAIRGAQASGTPFVSFFTLDEMVAVARAAGFREVRCVTAADLTQRYFVERSDGLRLGNAEALLLATT